MVNKKVTVQAIMTAPRYENTWCRTQIDAALKKLGIPLNVGLGVYYGQNMQRMMEDAIDKKIDYVVTIDFDTAFVAEQLHRLISITVQEDMDALCGLQCRRGKAVTLGCKEGLTMAKWDGYPIELDAGHFGLTVIKTERLAKVAKPWFHCQPDPDGSWGEKRVDGDVWFWHQWKNAGLKLYCDPAVRLGHLEEMLVIHDEQMNPVHVYPREWEKQIKEEIKQLNEESHDRADETVEEALAGQSVE